MKKVTENLETVIYTPIISEESYFKDTFIIEVERGCYNRCGFCLASYLNLPVRYVDYNGYESEEATGKMLENIVF